MNSASVYEIDKKMALLLAALTLSLAITNVLLIEQNKRLKAFTGNRPLELEAGTRVPAIEGKGINGERLKFDYEQDDRKTLLMIFSPKCGACKDNMPNWQDLVKGVDASRVRVVAVSLMPEGAGEYMTRYGMADLPMIAEVDPEIRVAYNMVVTPQTVLIAPDGKSEKVWTGLLKDEQKRDIETTLGVVSEARR